MITTFDIALPGKKLLIDPDSAERISEYIYYLENIYNFRLKKDSTKRIQPDILKRL